MLHYCSPISDIVHDKLFESAMIKIMRNNEFQLSTHEKRAEKSILVVSNEATTAKASCTHLSYFDKIKAMRSKPSCSQSRYADKKFIPATSASVSRFFTCAQWVMTSLRKNMSPILFESLSFFKLNRCDWDMILVSAEIKLKPDERYIHLDDDAYYEDKKFDR